MLDDYQEEYSPDSPIPDSTSVFEVPGGLWIKAESMKRVPGGLLLDGTFYPFSLWGMVDNAEVERLKQAIEEDRKKEANEDA